MTPIHEPSSPEQDMQKPSSMAEAIDSPSSTSITSAIYSYVALKAALKRPRTATSEDFLDDWDQPTKASIVVDGEGRDKNTRDAGNGPAQDSDEGHEGLPIWTPDLASLGPIICTSAWPCPTSPISPFFDASGTVSEHVAVVERWVYGSQHNDLQIHALASIEIWMRIIDQCDNMSIWSL